MLATARRSLTAQYLRGDKTVAPPGGSHFNHPDQDTDWLEILGERLNIPVYAEGNGADPREISRNALDYAKRHRAIIDRFGRYPHRNEILGRASTEEEIDFLKQPGSSF